jgi:hypothetical protein
LLNRNSIADKHDAIKEIKDLRAEVARLRGLVIEMWESAERWSGPTASSHYRSDIADRVGRARAALAEREGGDTECPRRDPMCDPACAEWAKGERSCMVPREGGECPECRGARGSHKMDCSRRPGRQPVLRVALSEREGGEDAK